METVPFAPATENSTRCLEAALPFLRHSAPEECLFVWGWECPSAFFSSGVLTASYPSQELWLQQGAEKGLLEKGSACKECFQFYVQTVLSLYCPTKRSNPASPLFPGNNSCRLSPLCLPSFNPLSVFSDISLLLNI